MFQIRTADEIATCGFIIESLIPAPTTDSIDALAVLPGLGQRERLTEAVELAYTFGVTHLIYTGENQEEIQAHGPADESAFFQLSGLVRFPSQSMQRAFQLHARHTPDQALFAIATCKDRALRRCILTAPGWHLTRAYLTFVRAALNAGFPVQLYPYPVASGAPMHPESEYHRASGYTTVARASAGELMRCLQYTKDVAGLKDLQMYLDWVGLPS